MPDLHHPFDQGVRGQQVVGYSDKEIHNKPKGRPINRREVIKAAKDLGYGRGVIRQLEDAETDEEITRIMTNARKRSLE